MRNCKLQIVPEALIMQLGTLLLSFPFSFLWSCQFVYRTAIKFPADNLWTSVISSTPESGKTRCRHSLNHWNWNPRNHNTAVHCWATICTTFQWLENFQTDTGTETEDNSKNRGKLVRKTIFINSSGQRQMQTQERRRLDFVSASFDLLANSWTPGVLPLDIRLESFKFLLFTMY